MISPAVTASEIIEALGLRRHPEGGHFRETWRDAPEGGGRGSGTAIYYLLRHGEVSEWPRLDATEVWHFYAGAPLALQVLDDTGHRTIRLGRDVAAGECPQAVVPAGVFQAATTTGEWTLVGCTVAPGFDFTDFDMPDRATLLTRFPDHRPVIEGFTR